MPPGKLVPRSHIHTRSGGPPAIAQALDLPNSVHSETLAFAVPKGSEIRDVLQLRGWWMLRRASTQPHRMSATQISMELRVTLAAEVR